MVCDRGWGWTSSGWFNLNSTRAASQTMNGGVEHSTFSSTLLGQTLLFPLAIRAQELPWTELNYFVVTEPFDSANQSLCANEAFSAVLNPVEVDGGNSSVFYSGVVLPEDVDATTLHVGVCRRIQNSKFPGDLVAALSTGQQAFCSDSAYLLIFKCIVLLDLLCRKNWSELHKPRSPESANTCCLSLWRAAPQ
jgi:hypothetical protein